MLPTYPNACPAGCNPYLNPSVPATGSNGIAPPSVAPSAANLNLSFITSTALSLPDKF